MPSALDRKFDAMQAAVTGEGGRIQIGKDEAGRAIVTNLPPTLPLLFQAFCALHADVELIADEERLTFAELDALSTRLARALAGSGIAKGDRIAIAMRNCPAWIVAWMAALKAGAIATLLNGWWESEEMRHAVGLSEPSLVIADLPRASRIEAAGIDARLAALDVDRPIEEAIAPLLGGPESELPEVGPGDDATILFTSGSTGRSRAAVSTHRAVTTGTYAYTLGLAVLLAIREGDGNPLRDPPRILVNVPFFHVTGEVPVLINSFVIGRSMVLMRRWDAGEALRLIEKEKITYFVGVPTMSYEMMEHPDRARRDLSTLTDIAAGGAPRPVAHVRRLEESFEGAQPALGYGLTETNAVGCSNFWSNYSEKPASTGRPQRPLVDLVILDDSGRRLGPGQRGEIAIRSAANIRGYWRDEEATRAAFTADGYLRTGDIGYLDEDDYLFIVDRAKDIIIRGGENISPQEVESALYAHPDVAEACVFGMADEKFGEVPVAVVHGAGKELDPAGLTEFLGGQVARFKIPARIWVSDAPLPRLGTGKFDRVALRAFYAGQAVEPGLAGA